jgi:hypothetical protein
MHKLIIWNAAAKYANYQAIRPDTWPNYENDRLDY